MEYVGVDKQRYSLWKCKCECGNYKIVRSSHLIKGKIISCGCLRAHKKLKSGTRFGRYTVLSYSHEKNKFHFYKVKCDCGNISTVEYSTLKKNKYGCRKCHEWQLTAKGLSKTRIYEIWNHMLFRCYNRKSESYKRYGERGIKVCKKWKEDFMAFYNWSLNNGYKENLSIDRINNDGNYEPDNCRWATREQQANNTSKNVFIDFNGKRLTISQWAHKIGILPSVFHGRLKRNGVCEKIFKKNMFSI